MSRCKDGPENHFRGIVTLSWPDNQAPHHAKVEFEPMIWSHPAILRISVTGSDSSENTQSMFIPEKNFIQNCMSSEKKTISFAGKFAISRA